MHIIYKFDINKLTNLITFNYAQTSYKIVGNLRIGNVAFIAT